MDPLTLIAVLFVVAYAPSIFLTILIARAKRYRREPRMAIFKAFLWGATGAAAIALVVNTVAQGAFVRPALRDEALTTIVTAVMVAPLVEETVKPLVLYMGTVKRNCDELVDGLIYGAVAGLGFAATENLLYEASALLSDGQESFIATAIARTFSSTLLHAIASAIVGYGIALHLNRRWGFFMLIPFFLLAVLIHAGYNAIVSLAPGIVIIPLVIIVIWGFVLVRRRIRTMSLVSPSKHWIVLRQQSAPQNGPPKETWRPVPPSDPPPSRGPPERWARVRPPDSPPPQRARKRPSKADDAGEDAEDEDHPAR